MNGSAITPTDEQLAARAAFDSGATTVIEAGAGTGKTSTLVLLGRSRQLERGQYIAFNKAIVTDASAKMPGNVNCSTAHSLAFRAVGTRFAHRLNSGRMRSMEIARRLRIDPIVVSYGDQRKPLAVGYLAGLVMRTITRFCQSADETPAPSHVPYIDGIDAPEGPGRPGWANNRLVRDHVMPYVRDAWADLVLRDGQLPYRHEHYLKLWHLSEPRIPVDFIMFDEAQDANPVMASIVSKQHHAQRVYVGDSEQAIYEFTGAVNAMAGHDGKRVFLTRSFRFGPPIAVVANRLLETLPTELRLRGSPGVSSVVDAVAEPHCILSRTNARAVRAVIGELGVGRRPYLVGGADEIVRFAKAAQQLMNDEPTGHPELACFVSWNEVREYVAEDPQGDELKLMVELIDEFTVPVILRSLEQTVTEDRADVVVSTAHKSKGREWPSVRLLDDFPQSRVDADIPERRLLYVGATRARHELDVEAVPWLLGDDADDDADAAGLTAATAADAREESLW